MTKNASSTFDIFHSDYITNPNPMVDRMLANSPIFYDPRLGWMIGRYRDIMELQGDPRLSSRRLQYVTAGLSPALQEMIKPLVDWYAQWITMMDEPGHTRLHRLGARAFQPNSLSRLESHITELVDRLIDQHIDGGSMEFVHDFAFPLAYTIICEMVGIPEVDRRRSLEWTDDMSTLLAAGLNTAEAIQHGLKSYEQMRVYYEELLAVRRQNLVENEILSNLIVASEKEDRLTAEEVINLVAFIMTAGYDTIAHLLANGLLLLLTHPEQLLLLRQDPSLIPNAVEEMLRYEPSITVNARSVVAPIDFKGHRFEPGQMLYILAYVANHDPEQFPEPHRFDVTRKGIKHVSFGFGAHHCLGAALARLEAQIVFRQLLVRLPTITLPEQPIERGPNFITRPLKRLVIKW